jgi:hypothetical protein
MIKHFDKIRKIYNFYLKYIKIISEYVENYIKTNHNNFIGLLLFIKYIYSNPNIILLIIAGISFLFSSFVLGLVFVFVLFDSLILSLILSHRINMKINSQEPLQLSNNAIVELVKQNQDFKQLIIEQNNKIIELTKDKNVIMNNTTNNNTTNNKFNLNFFLNEQCKDALNMIDFIDSLKMKLSDLEAIGKVGYSEGISKIFIRGLKELDIFKRPIHCCDIKREIMYLRNDDIWKKENDKRENLKRAINRLADKNIQQIPDWIKENPESNNYESKKHYEYIKMLGESMGGKTDEETDKNINKIIKNIAKEVLIEKTQ